MSSFAGTNSNTTGNARGLSPVIIGKAIHPPWNEGVRVIARNLGRALQSAGHPARTVSLSDAAYAPYFQGGVETVHVPSRSTGGVAGDYRNLASVARAAVTAAGPGAAIFHLVGAPLALAPLIRSRGRRVIAHIPLSRHMYLSPTDRLRAHIGWRAFDRWIDAYACTSGQVAHDLAAQGYPRRKLFVVPPPLDVRQFSTADRAEARQSLGLDPDAFLVLYVGTVSPLRFPGAEVMRALGAASASVPNLALKIFAPVATHDYNIRWAEENVRKATAGPGVSVNVNLRDLSEDEKVLAYSAADVVLLPFAAPVAVEPPLTLLEAMACRAAVVVSPYANSSRVVESGITGYTYASPDELAARITELHSAGAEGRASLGEKARAAAVQNYSFKTVANAIEKLWTATGVPRAENSIGVGSTSIETRSL